MALPPSVSPTTPDAPAVRPGPPAPGPVREGDTYLDALSDALAAIGDRWSLLVAAVLLDGPSRFGELQERLPGIAPNILSQRLRRLEERGLVLAQPYSDRPPRYLYELTGAGRELTGVLRLLTDWGIRHTSGEALEPPRHESCGSELQARWYCPICREAVAEPGEDAGGELYYA